MLTDDNPTTRNLLLLTDSYKHSHWAQLPPGTTRISEYLESRGGAFSYSRFFGLQWIIKRHLLKPFTLDDIVEADEIVGAHMGPGVFNAEGWRLLLERHGGLLPLEISAVPEGTDVPVRNVLMQIVNTDPAFPWLVTFVETLLQQVWAPTTVCTLSAEAKAIIERDLAVSSDGASAELGLQDFGLRGVATMESGGVLGAAHLVNFKGTDTLPALLVARYFYGARDMPGLSIPAGEHSEILAWEPAHEAQYFEQSFDRFLKESGIFAAPIDTYDDKQCVQDIVCRRLRVRIKESGGTYVARPDSGDPRAIVPWVLRRLGASFGTSRNGKGFRVLHPSVRVIFGDGMNLGSIAATNGAVMDAGFSTENVVYGMGGGLLQKIDRDTQRFAIKASAVQRGNRWIPVRKTVASDVGKSSKAGRLALVHDGAGFATVPVGRRNGRVDLLRPVFRNGRLLVDDTLPAIRARAALNPVFFKVA